MKKCQSKKKQDLFAISIFVITFFTIFFLLTKGQFLYGSTLDWKNQHYLIPEYFRNLFYQTKNLFPDFAFHLGGGQNIYYFSYYGLLSPFILLSYLLPFIKMVDYIQIIGCVIPILSTVLFYFYLRHHTSYSVSLLLSFLFLCASPVIFHSHRHWMFINYFPFFMMSLFGIDNYFEKGKISLLGFSLFLLIMTSYYYSVGSLVCLFCYGIYYGIKNKKWTMKKFILFFLPFFLGIMMSMVILLPTLYTLLHGRDMNTDSISLLTLLTPKRNFPYFLYGSYTIGLTAISLVGTLYLLFEKRKEDLFFGIFILLMSSIPIFNYILNGTLYISAKSLIPFLPCILIFLIPFFESLFSNQIHYKRIGIIILFLVVWANSKRLYLDLAILSILLFLYDKTKKKNLFIAFLMCMSFACCIYVNVSDKLEPKEEISDPIYLELEDMVSYITEQEDNLYRINTNYDTAITMNKVYNSYHLTSTLYSSTFNKNYNQFFFDIANNAIPYRNRSMTPASTHLIFQMLMGEKYIISSDKEPFYYQKIYEKNGLSVYETENVLPIGYASSNLVSKSSYDKLSYPENILTLLHSVVIEEGGETKESVLEKVTPDFEIQQAENVSYKKIDDQYQILASDNASLKIKLNMDLEDKILFVRFKNNYNPNCHKEELAMTINGTKNKLTCSSWKYHNQNYVFDYVFYNTDTLDITFTEGKYLLSDFEIYVVDSSILSSVGSDVSTFIFDKEKTKGNHIYGSIDVEEDGYFVFSIPYDNGFTAYVDGKKVDVENVNESFIGFKIEKGNHTIHLVYEAPFKKIGLYISIITFILSVMILVYEKRKSFNQR